MGVMVREGGPPTTLRRFGQQEEVVGGLPAQTMTRMVAGRPPLNPQLLLHKLTHRLRIGFAAGIQAALLVQTKADPRIDCLSAP